MSSNSNLSAFYRGDTKVWGLSFKDSVGAPIDVTGHELWFTMKREITDLDEDAVLQKKIIFSSGAESENGIGTLTLDSTETGAIDPGNYFFDLQKVIPGSPPIVATLISGKISVLPDVTRSTGA
ncbi:MAG: hypothetical protein HQL07_03900 [Nitrospirae bacterium]|nr:hypothetical protein [Magnetococcales bacterium]HAT48864.1 hypothetical protein [Alphaproteobacteria bacterium]